MTRITVPVKNFDVEANMQTQEEYTYKIINVLTFISFLIIIAFLYDYIFVFGGYDIL
jgi:hypothetical protein